MPRKTPIHLCMSLILIFGGGYLAHTIQTAGGSISVRNVRFTGSTGTLMSGLLYVPQGASRSSPRPGILAVHGYINSRETQDGFAIEFARRGYVVLALDQTGHGYSDPPAFANGFGGPDGLRYLASLDEVDDDNIGLERHSMGGWAVLIAANENPQSYRSIVIAGSSTGTAGAPEGTADTPRNLGVIFSRWDEFSGFMWGAPVPTDIVTTPKLMSVFGTTEPVEAGRLYGSVADGTGRIPHMPSVTHSGDHLSTEAIGQAVSWMQRTLHGGNDLPPEDQTWYWKEFGTLLSLAGGVWFLFPIGTILLGLRPFRYTVVAPITSESLASSPWSLAGIATIIVPAATYFWLHSLGSAIIPVNVFWSQSVTTGIAFWTMANGAFSAAGLLAWRHGAKRHRDTGSPRQFGLDRGWHHGILSLFWAACTAGALYVLLLAVEWLFLTDFRFWVLAVKPIGWHHMLPFLTYLPAFSAFFLVLGVVLHRQIRAGLLSNVLLLTAGFMVLLLIQYVPLLSGGTMPLGEPLLSIFAFQVLPLLGTVALISTYCYRWTESVYPGAFLNGIFITWVVTAGQTIQYGG